MARNKYGGVNDMPAGWLANKENKRVYVLWFDMLRRCYDEEQLKRVQGSTYRDCSVCDRWFYLSNFYEDIQKLPGYLEWVNNRKMSIDKDLFSHGSKEYSPQNCCFVPMAVNISEAGRRNIDNIRKLHKTNRVRYVFSKGNEKIVFNSEKEACEAMGVRQCSVASCYRRGRRCKGYTIARMDKEDEHEAG